MTRPFTFTGSITRGLPVAAAVLAGAAALAGCGERQPPPTHGAEATVTKDAVTLSESAARTAGVTLATVRAVDRTDQIEAPGAVKLDERHTARLGALVEGVVRRIDVQPGDRVRAGQTLALVHSHAVHDGWAAYYKALAARRSAERSLTFAQTAEQRAIRLFEDKAFSRQEAERASADRVHAEQALAAARAEIVRCIEELEHYGMAPPQEGPDGVTPPGNAAPQEQIRIVAPFAGVIVERLVSEGAAIVPGTPLVVLSNLDTVWVSAEVDERDLSRLAPGRDAEFTVAAYPDRHFPGRIDAIGDTVDPITRRVVVRVTAANPNRQLKPEMFATVRLGAAEPRRALVIPTAAVQHLDGAAIVFVQAGEGRYQRRDVSLGPESNGEVEITRGVREGERVVTGGAFLMKSALAGPAQEP